MSLSERWIWVLGSPVITCGLYGYIPSCFSGTLRFALKQCILLARRRTVQNYFRVPTPKSPAISYNPVALKLEPYLIVLLILVPVVVGIKFLYRSRAKAMCALAARWSFVYSDGDTRMFGGRRPVHYPTGFKMKCYPVYAVSKIFNVIDGERNGVRVLIFDSVVGEGRGARFCTLVATQTSENIFKNVSSREKTAQRAGWTAVYRIPFISMRPGTISINRIEELLDNL